MIARSTRRAVSEIMATTILILISVAIGTSFYLFAKASLDLELAEIKRTLDANMRSLVTYVIVDAFYISENSTIVLYLYTSRGESVIFDKVYIDDTLVPEDNYIGGFGVPIRVNYPNKFVFVHQLTSGPHRIKITGPGGIRAEGIIYVAG
jgi:hypothetical protein